MQQYHTVVDLPTNICTVLYSTVESLKFVYVKKRLLLSNIVLTNYCFMYTFKSNCVWSGSYGVGLDQENLPYYRFICSNLLVQWMQGCWGGWGRVRCCTSPLSGLVEASSTTVHGLSILGLFPPGVGGGRRGGTQTEGQGQSESPFTAW